MSDQRQGSVGQTSHGLGGNGIESNQTSTVDFEALIRAAQVRGRGPLAASRRNRAIRAVRDGEHGTPAVELVLSDAGQDAPIEATAPAGEAASETGLAETRRAAQGPRPGEYDMAAVIEKALNRSTQQILAKANDLRVETNARLDRIGTKLIDSADRLDAAADYIEASAALAAIESRQSKNLPDDAA